MADADVTVTFSADTGSLSAGIAIAKAQLSSLNSEANKLAAQMVATGQQSNTALLSALTSITGEAETVKLNIGTMSSALKGAGGAITDVASHASAAGPGFSFMTRELRALGDEATSGRWRQFDGTLVNIIGHSVGIISAFVAANPALTALGVAVAAAGGALAYLDIQASKTRQELEQLRESANLGGGVQLSDAQLKTYLTTLQSLKGETSETAQAALAAFQSMSDASSASIKAVVSDYQALVAAGEKPEEAQKKLTKAFGESLTSMSAITALLPNLTSAERQQIKAAQDTGSATAAQAAIQQIFAARNAESAAQQIAAIQKLIDAKKDLMAADERAVASGVGNPQDIATIKDLISLWQDQIDAIKRASDAVKGFSGDLRNTPANVDKLNIEAGETAKKFDPADTKLQELEKDLKQLQDQLDRTNTAAGGIGTGLKASTADAAALIKQFEGFSTAAKWDVNAFRVGYGSDTTTNAQTGQVSPVTADTTTTQADAEADLARRIVEFQATAAQQIGPIWATLADNVKASLTSVAYNYGKLPGSVVAAGQTGDNITITEAISSLKANPERRAAEAANVTAAPASALGAQGAGGAPSPYGTLPSTFLSPDQESQTLAAMANIKQQIDAIKQAQAGGNAEQQQSLRAAEQEAQADQSHLTILQGKLSAQNQIVAQLQAEGVTDDRLTVAVTKQKEIEGEVRKAKEDQVEATERLAAATQKTEGNALASLQIELQAAKQKAGLAEQGSTEQIDALARVQAAQQAVDNEIRNETDKTAENTIAKAQEAAKGEEIALQQKLATHQITEAQWLQQSTATLEQEKAAVMAAYDQELAVANLTSDQIIEIKKREQASLAQIADQEATAQKSAAEKTESAWKSATQEINSAFDSQIDGLLTGTETWAQAFKNIIKSLTEDLIKAGLNKLLTGAENSIGGAASIPGASAQGAGLGSVFAPLLSALGLNTAATTAHTTATATGAAATGVNTTSTTLNSATTGLNTTTTGVNTGAAAVGTAATSLNTGATTVGTVAQTAGNVTQGINTAAVAPNTIATIGNTVATELGSIANLFGFAEGTPYVQQTGIAVIHKGEAIIPASKNPYTSFDIGSYSISKDMIANLHAGEMVVPAKGGIADEFRNFMAAGGVAGGAGGPGGNGGAGSAPSSGGGFTVAPTAHYHVSAIDTASGAEWLRNNSEELAKTMDKAVRGGAALGLRRV